MIAVLRFYDGDAMDGPAVATFTAVLSTADISKQTDSREIAAYVEAKLRSMAIDVAQEIAYGRFVVTEGR